MTPEYWSLYDMVYLSIWGIYGKLALSKNWKSDFIEQFQLIRVAKVC
jgi:hypothetical protein